MDEIKRFFRYTLPGIACIIQLLIALSVSNDINWTPILDNINKVNFAAFALGGFIICAGIGFIFAQIYWGLYWSICKNLKITKDHRHVLKEVSDSFSNFKIVNIQNMNKWLEALTIEQAWNFITFYILENKRLMEKYAGLGVMDRLVDVSHSLGTTIVGSIIALITWCIINVNNCMADSTLRIGEKFYVIAIWVPIIVIFCFAFYRSHVAHLSVTNMLFVNDVAKKMGKAAKLPFNYYYSD